MCVGGGLTGDVAWWELLVVGEVAGWVTFWNGRLTILGGWGEWADGGRWLGRAADQRQGTCGVVAGRVWLSGAFLWLLYVIECLLLLCRTVLCCAVLSAGVDGSQVLAHLPAAHLSDHPGAVTALMAVLTPGLTLPGPLLVLQHQRINPEQHPALNRWQGGEGEQGLGDKGAQNPEDSSEEEEEGEGEEESSEDEQPQQQRGKQRGQQQKAAAAGDAMEVDGQEQQEQQQEGEKKVPVLLVSRKPSLLSAAAEGKLPGSAGEVLAGAVLPGYVASVTRDGGETEIFVGLCRVLGFRSADCNAACVTCRLFFQE